MDRSSDGTMLAVMGSLGGGLDSFVASLAPATGDVAWQSAMPYLRGVEISDDNQYVVVYGQGTLSSYGSYDLFVAKVSATDGDGVWAMNGGGDGMEYFWGMGMDATGGIYISGYSRSHLFRFGEQSMSNAMSAANGGDGQNTIYTIKLSSTTTMPSCLSSCSLPLSPASGTCFIDHHCYTHGAYSSYGAHQ